MILVTIKRSSGRLLCRPTFKNTSFMFSKIKNRISTFSFWNNMSTNADNVIKFSEWFLYWFELTVTVSVFTLIQFYQISSLHCMLWNNYIYINIQYYIKLFINCGPSNLILTGQNWLVTVYWRVNNLGM